VKDQVIVLTLEVPFRKNPPLDPFVQNFLPLNERYNAKNFLEKNRKLDFPPGWDYVKAFRDKKYNLAKANAITSEMEAEFVRANHKIEFDNTLPFSNERQAMFRGLLDEDMFIPLPARLTTKHMEMGQISQALETRTFLRLLTQLKRQHHRADENKNRILLEMNEAFMSIDNYHFIMTSYSKIYNPKDFLLNQKYASDECWRELISKMLDMHYEVDAMVNHEKAAMKQRNEDRKRTIIIEADRKALEEKELPRQVVESIRRFQFLLNMQFEIRIRFILQRSSNMLNRTFSLILEKVLTILQKPLNFPLEQFDWEMLHEYQLKTQYENFETGKIPLILTNLELDEKGTKITVHDDMSDLKEKLCGLLTENLAEILKIEC
jgi:hypothetical protein